MVVSEQNAMKMPLHNHRNLQSDRNTKCPSWNAAAEDASKSLKLEHLSIQPLQIVLTFLETTGRHHVQVFGNRLSGCRTSTSSSTTHSFSISISTIRLHSAVDQCIDAWNHFRRSVCPPAAYGNFSSSGQRLRWHGLVLRRNASTCWWSGWLVIRIVISAVNTIRRLRRIIVCRRRLLLRLDCRTAVRTWL